jgi:hypothetical protein
MSRFRRHIAQVVPPLLLSMALAACATDLGGPDSRTVPKAPAFYNTAVPTQLSIVDADDGTQYTLDILAREIRMSDGRVLVLDSLQTLQATAAFSQTIATDPVSAEVAHFTYTPICSKIDPCPQPDFAVTQPPPPMWREGHAERPIRRHARVSRQERQGDLGLGAFAFASFTSTDPCSDVANVAVTSVTNYANSRTRFIKDPWPLATSIGNSALRKMIPPFSSAAQKFADMVTLHYNTSTQVNVLAFYWNTYSCSSKHVTAGPIYQSSGGGSSTYTCEDQRWEISFDGGKTWSPIWVRVCYFAD